MTIKKIPEKISIICDFCLVELENYSDRRYQASIKIIAKEFDYCGNGYLERTEKDLCDDCYLKFLNFCDSIKKKD